MVKNVGLFLLLFYSALASSTSLKNNWVFYQPQLRDSEVSTIVWQKMLLSLKKDGIKGIVFQWSTSDEDTQNNSIQLKKLQKIFTLAEQSNLQVIIGLHADSDFFKRIKQPASSLKYYLNKQSTLSMNVAKQWKDVWASDAFSGWYITQEVDDYHWRDTARRSLLLEFLQRLNLQLSLLNTGKPIYISAYLGGFQSATVTVNLLNDINLEGQIEVWLQDGLGTGALTDKQRNYYFPSLLACKDIDKGIIYEFFREQKETSSFSAIPANAEQWQFQKEIMAEYCQTKKLIFSLRYLPVAHGILNY